MFYHDLFSTVSILGMWKILKKRDIFYRFRLKVSRLEDYCNLTKTYNDLLKISYILLRDSFVTRAAVVKS